MHLEDLAAFMVGQLTEDHIGAEVCRHRLLTRLSATTKRTAYQHSSYEAGFWSAEGKLALDSASRSLFAHSRISGISQSRSSVTNTSSSARSWHRSRNH